MPSSRARLFIISTKPRSLPAIPSASVMQASLPDWTNAPWIRSSTLTRLWIAANMLDVWDGAPPRRQASSLTRYSVSSLMRPCLSSLNTTSDVISLAMLEGGVGVSAYFSNNTVPLSASSRMT